jgi:hypothetical protein
MLTNAVHRAVLVAALSFGQQAIAAGSTNAALPDGPSSQPAVTLTINPDGSAAWNGVPLTNEPALKNKLTHQAQHDPRLQLDVQFHSVGQLNDSNRKTLLDILELTAKFGYVHVEPTEGGARLTVLGPNALPAAPK